MMINDFGSRTAHGALGLLSFLWNIVGAVIIAVLMLLEPLLRFTLVPLAFLLFLGALLFGFLMGVPEFPKWGMMALAIVMILAYWAYLWLMSVFTRLPHEID